MNGAYRRPLLLVAGLMVALGLAGQARADPSRFVVSEPVAAELVVTDLVTGLMWDKDYATGKTWQQALEYCEDRNHAGETDWRLPNRNELMSLVSYERYSPASDFPDMPSQWFWSSSSGAYGPANAWGVKFNYGYVGSDGEPDAGYVRCVRLGP